MSFSTPLAWYWVAAPLVVATLAVLLLLRALFHIAHGRLGHGGLHAGGGVVLALTALCAGLIVLNSQSFARLTAERAIADIVVAGIDPADGLYHVTVRRLDIANATTECNLRGDEWLLSARVQKWKPWANVLGLDSTYTLDQIANKYSSARLSNGKLITACDLQGSPDEGALAGFGAWLMARSYAEQRRFGLAVYMPLTDGAIYRIIMTQSGLNAEPVNPIAQRAVIKGI